MKFENGSTANGVNIPPAALKRSGFNPQEGDGAEYRALNGCVVVLKKTMNASELIRAAWALHMLSVELCAQITKQCAKCEGQCGSCDGECPYSEADFSVDMEVPEEFRALAGLSDDAILHVEFPEDGGILIRENDGDPGLWDVPVPMMAGLLASGVCPASLEELLKSGETVYGKEKTAP